MLSQAEFLEIEAVKDNTAITQEELDRIDELYALKVKQTLD